MSNKRISLDFQLRFIAATCIGVRFSLSVTFKFKQPVFISTFKIFSSPENKFKELYSFVSHNERMKQTVFGDVVRNFSSIFKYCIEVKVTDNLLKKLRVS